MATQVVVACSTTSSTPQSVAPPSASEMAGSLGVQALGLNIPWAVGGLRLERDGTAKVNAGDWPTVPFRSLRLWDTRTAWLHLEPARGQYVFDQLDALVAKATANGVDDITLVLGGTPQWAASSIQATDASWMGPGSASMPNDLGAWAGFADTVARRYAGRITSYEIGNEPNLRTFWSGTAEDYARFVTTAADAIRAADPAATIVANAGLVRSRYDVATLAKWLAPLSSAVTGGRLNAVSLHYYPQAGQVGDAPEILKSMKAALASNGFGAVPAWITEVNVRSAPTLAPQAQANAVLALGRQMMAAGFVRAYWYAWTDMSADDLVPFQPGSSGAAALAALGGTAPSAGPTVPSAGPTVPSAGPSVPSAGPVAPTADPAAPSADPAAPSAGPTAPQ